MNIECRDIEAFMEEWAPSCLAEDWDNVGLLLGSSSQVIKRVLVSLDVTDAVANEAIEKKVDLIISHHPLIFDDIKRVNENDLKGEIICKLIKSNVAVFAAHTNLDVTDNGVNDSLANILDLKKLKNLNHYKSEDIKGKEYGLGKVGFLENPLSFYAFIEKIKIKLCTSHIRTIGKKPASIQKVAVFCGSFDGNLSNVIKQAPDVLVTGDIKYHIAQEIVDLGMFVIDAGHFATERIIIPQIAQGLKTKFSELDITVSLVEEDPIKTY